MLERVRPNLTRSGAESGHFRPGSTESLPEYGQLCATRCGGANSILEIRFGSAAYVDRRGRYFSHAASRRLCRDRLRHRAGGGPPSTPPGLIPWPDGGAAVAPARLPDRAPHPPPSPMRAGADGARPPAPAVPAAARCALSSSTEERGGAPAEGGDRWQLGGPGRERGVGANNNTSRLAQFGHLRNYQPVWSAFYQIWTSVARCVRPHSGCARPRLTSLTNFGQISPIFGSVSTMIRFGSADLFVLAQL